jgi:hypothetical protein
MQVKAGSVIPLWVAIDDGSEDLVIYARVTSRDPFTVHAEAAALDFIEYSEGEYENNAVEMPDVPAVDVVYSVYESDGTTLIRKAYELFLRDDGGGGGAGTGEIIGEVDTTDELIGVVEVCS